jgi:hypothetical protein
MQSDKACSNLSWYILLLTSRASVWPNVPIRLCQFHVIQAIIRWDRDVYINADSREYSNPRLSTSLKRRVLWAFRELQRCRQEEDWEVYRQTFEARLKRYLENEGALFARVLGYFTDNWFTEEWRGMY